MNALNHSAIYKLLLLFSEICNSRHDINIGYRYRIITRYLAELRMFQLNHYDVNKLNICIEIYKKRCIKFNFIDFS